MTARRRCPRPARGETHEPAASGPRCARESRIVARVAALAVRSRSKSTQPQMPHTGGGRSRSVPAGEVGGEVVPLEHWLDAGEARLAQQREVLGHGEGDEDVLQRLTL